MALEITAIGARRMLGPEAVPYGSIGTYANTLSATYNLSAWQTKHMLVNEIPKHDLRTVGRHIYEQTAPIADTPEVPEYYGALESIAWADKLNTGNRRYSKLVGGLGTGIGGAVAIGAESIFLYSQAPAEVSTTAHNYTFIEAAESVATLAAPVIITGIVGTYLGKRFASTARKAFARAVAQRVYQAQEDPDRLVPDATDFPDIDVAAIRIARKTQLPTGSHMERVANTQLYPTAKRWANLSGCDDRQQYANFLLADMPPRELTKLIVQTKKFHQDILDGTIDPSPQDPRYANLLHDLHIANDVLQSRTDTRNGLKKAYRGLGYLGALTYMAASATSAESSGEHTAITYPLILQLVGSVSLLPAAAGSLAADLFSRRVDGFTRLRAKRAVAKARK